MRRFDAGSYVVLCEVRSSHDVGRGRGGTRAALSRVTAPTLVAGVDTDRLYPLSQQAELAALVPTAHHLRVVESPHGHDGFLTGTEQVSALVKEILTTTHQPVPDRRGQGRRTTRTPAEAADESGSSHETALLTGVGPPGSGGRVPRPPREGRPLGPPDQPGR